MWRRLAPVGAVLAVIGLIAVSATRTRPHPPRPARFENPETAVADAQLGAVFEYVLAVLSSLNAGQFQEAGRLTGHLPKAAVPTDAQTMFSVLTDVLGKEVSLVEAAERWIRDITALTQAGRTAEAQRLLAELDRQVRGADLLLAELSEGAEDLRASTQRDLQANPAQRKAFDDLQQAAARIKGFLAIYRATTKTPASAAALGRLLPYETVIDITAADRAYPGRPFEMRGRIFEHAPSPSRLRHATVELDGQPMGEVTPGAVDLQFAMPRDLASGVYELQVRVPEQGRYRAARWTKTIQVSHIPVRLTASFPTWVTVPGGFSIKGSVTSDLGPLEGAIVHVTFASRDYYRVTSDSGEFQISGSLPAALSLGGPTEFFVAILPQEPWHAPMTDSHRLITVNLISTGALATLFLAGIVFVVTQRNGNAQVMAPTDASALAGSTVARISPAASPPQFRGALAEEILAIYGRVIRQLEAAFGTQTRAATTLREFMRRLPMQTGSDTLWRLTALAEQALYSSHPVTPDQVKVAHTLSGQLEGALRGVR